MFKLPELTPVTVPVQVVNAVELKALDPNSLVPTTLEPFIITAVASEDWSDRPDNVKVLLERLVPACKLFTKV